MEWSTGGSTGPGVSKLINFDLNIANIAIRLTEHVDFKVIITMTIVLYYSWKSTNLKMQNPWLIITRPKTMHVHMTICTDQEHSWLPSLVPRPIFR